MFTRLRLAVVATLIALASFGAPRVAWAAPSDAVALHTTPHTQLTPMALVAVEVAADSVPATTPPPASTGINGYQMLAVTFLGSLFTYLLSHYWAGFSGLGDVGKWLIVLLSSLVVSGVVHLIHGDLSPDVSSALKAALDGLAAAIASGSIFKFGTTKPAS